MPPKRKPKKRRAPAPSAPKPKRKSKHKKAPRKKVSPKRSPRKRATPKRKPATPKRSRAAKRGWATRRRHAKERDSDRGDVVVVKGGRAAWKVSAKYAPFKIKTRSGKVFVRRRYEVPADAAESAPDLPTWFRDDLDGGGYSPADSLATARDQADLDVEWFPTFDEIYDYIDALVDEFDLDAHELFELAYGYSDEVAA